MPTQLLLGARIHSPSSPDATAMAVTDGMVVWVGADKPSRALHPDAEIIDLDGAFVAPAFVDAHVHITSTGLALSGLDLAAARSLADCLARVRAFALEHPQDTVLLGQGWDDSAWPERRPPTLEELDAATGGRPAYLPRVDVHSALCSSALLAMIPSAAQSRSAVVSGAAHHEVRRVALGCVDAAHRDRARRAALDAFAAAGVVAVHECAGPEVSGQEDLADLLALRHGVQVHAYWGEAVASAAEARAVLARTGAHGLAGDLFVDGSFGSRTAWLCEPYTDAPTTCGTRHLDPDAIEAHVRACTEAGVQAGFHAIGDAAVTAVVEAFERTAADTGTAAVAGCAHRVEHLELISVEQASRLAALGVIASVQPSFDAIWGGTEGMYATRLGVRRAEGLNPFSALAAAGVPLAFGSDAPVTPLDPWMAVRAAVHHRTPGHGISPRAAFGAATRGAWRAGGVHDGLTGTLTPGAPASYAVWDAQELVVAAGSSSDDAVRRWSTDPRALVPPLPRLDPGLALPRCVRTVHRGTTIYGA